MKSHFSKTAALIFFTFILSSFVALNAQQQRPTAPPMMSTFGGGTGFGSGATVPIGAGDLLEMSVFDTPELSGKLRVSNTGDVSLPLVGSLHVEGMKADAAQALIRQRYIDGGFVKDPQVTLFIAEYATQGVSVMGEVKSPGIYPAFGSHHLLDYLSVAQGLTPMAGTRVTITHVDHPDEPQHIKMTAGAAPQPENNPEIKPGDTIFVERTGLVYVVGDVAHPGGFPMDHDQQLSILQAVALAQGTLPTAAKSSAKLIRTTAQGRQEIPLNLKKILQSKETDIAMQDNDILFVPSSAAKSTLKDIEGALPAAASATIYRIP
ncbi:MAG TPA: polysaccharide biosynthesis/export family protein [Terriglobales bacterium]|nr:polysaccharide biosynthesis/export family protein [Terriglobales bacterium]